MMNATGGSDARTGCFFTAIHDRRVSVWGRVSSLPVQTHAVAFSGPVRPGERIICTDGDSTLPVRITDQHLIVEKEYRPGLLERLASRAGHGIEGGFLKIEWESDARTRGRRVLFHIPICDAMESWSFYLTDAPLRLDQDADYRQICPGVFVLREDERRA